MKKVTTKTLGLLFVLLALSSVRVNAATVTVSLTGVQSSSTLCSGGFVSDTFTISSDTLFYDTVLVSVPSAATGLAITAVDTNFKTSIASNIITITRKNLTGFSAGVSYVFRLSFSLPCNYAGTNGKIPVIANAIVPAGKKYKIVQGSTITNNLPYTFNTSLLAPVISNSVTTVTVPINPSTSTTFSIPFVSSGNANFLGYLQITSTNPCGNKRLKNLQLIDTTTNTVLFSNGGANVSFPFNINTNIAIPTGHVFKFVMEVNDTLPCNVTACNMNIVLNWGCGSNLCKNTGTVNLNFTKGNQVPLLNIIRLSPSRSGSQTQGWEGSCSGGNNAETQWDYLIQNIGGAKADSIIFILRQDLRTSYTFVRKNSIAVNNATRVSAYPTLTVSPVSSTLSTRQLTTASFPTGGNIPHCVSDLTIGGDFPVDSATVFFLALQPGERVLISFSTYRCCPSDVSFNTPIFFNRWQRKVSAKFCNGTAVNVVSSETLVSPPLSAAVSDFANSYFNYISLQNYKGAERPDLALRQQEMNSTTDIAAPKGGCGSFQPFLIQNMTYNSTSNNIADFDAMLFSQYPMAGGVSGVQGANPYIRFHIDIKWQGSLNGQNLVIVSDSVTWTPINVVQTGTSLSGDFLISSLPPAIRATSFNFRNFFIGSLIRFDLQACCPTSNPNPKIIVQTSQDLRVNGITCDTCMVKLASDTFGLFMHCPGCVTPGLITYDHHLWRNNFEYADSNDNGLPERQGANSLIPITPNYNKWDYVNKIGSIVGDTLRSVTSAFFVDGDNAGGFNYATWQTNWTPLNGGITPRLDHVYFEQIIDNAALVGLDTVGTTTVTYRHAGTTTTINIAKPKVTTSGTQRKFLYHVAASEFATSVHFLPSDTFTFVSKYISCTNPVDMVPLDILNAMMLSPKAYTATMNDPWNSYPTLPDYYHKRDSLGFHGWTAVQPDTPVLYLCEAFGGRHKVYPVTVRSTEKWTDGNSCSKQLVLTYSTRIGTSNDFDLFPYEYRLAPGLISSALNLGMIIPNTSLLTFQVRPINGYRIRPLYSYSDAFCYVDRVGIPTIRTQVPGSMVNQIDSNYTIGILQTSFNPLFEGLYSLNLTPTTAPIVTQFTTPNKLLIIAQLLLFRQPFSQDVQT